MTDYNADADAAVRKDGWIQFTKLMTYASVAVAAVLVLMAIFLV